MSTEASKSKIMQYKELILALAALAAGLGGVFKPTDTTATEKTHQLTTSQIQMIVEANQELRTDLAVLRTYVKAVHSMEAAVDPEPEPVARNSRRRVAAAPKPARKPAPTLPPMKSKRRTYHATSFDQVVQAKMPSDIHAIEEFEAEEAEEEAILDQMIEDGQLPEGFEILPPGFEPPHQ